MIDELNLNSVNGTQSQSKLNMSNAEDIDIDIPTTKEVIKSNLNKNKFSKKDQDDSRYYKCKTLVNTLNEIQKSRVMLTFFEL